MFILQLFSHKDPRHSKTEDIFMGLKEPGISGKRKKKINHMQDEKGTLKYEQKDYHQGLSLKTTTASSASIKTKSSNQNHILRVHYSSGSKDNPFTEESTKNLKFPLKNSRKGSNNQYFIRGVYTKQQNANKTENIDKNADSHRNYHKIPVTNNDKSHSDDTFFSEKMVVKATSKNVMPTKSLKGYEVRNNGTSFTPMLNNMYTTMLENTSNKPSNKSQNDKNNKTHSSSDLFPKHQKKISQNKLEKSDGVKNVEKWWHTKVGSERLRQPKQQNINLIDQVEKVNNISDAKNQILDNINSVENELFSVSDSKLHVVRVLPPQDFIDKLKDEKRNNLEQGSINGLDFDEKMDKKALDLMKLFMDHTDDFELDAEEITDLKKRAKDIEGQVYKENLRESGNRLEGRKPRLSQIILNKIKEAEEISKLKNSNKHNKLETYLMNNMEKDAYEKEDTNEFSQIEERSGPFQIMNSSEQTLQPRFSSLMFGQERQKSFPRRPSLNFKENSFRPSARTVDDRPSARSLDEGFSSIFSGPPHRPKHFSKFGKTHRPGPPILSSIPPTSFSCTDEVNSDVKRTAGYYADPETDCQVSHIISK